MKNQKTQDKINTFFTQLMGICYYHMTIKSVEEATKELGVEFQQAESWANENDHWKEIFEECVAISLWKNDKAGWPHLQHKYKLPLKEAFEWMYETNAEYRKAYDEEEEFKRKSAAERQRKEEREELERSGKEAPIQRSVIMDINPIEHLSATAPTETPLALPEMTEQEEAQIRKWWATRDATEKERYEQWNDRQAKENPGFTYKEVPEENQDQNDKNTPKPTKVTIKFDDHRLTPSQKAHMLVSNYSAMTGSVSHAYGEMLINQTLAGFFGKDNGEQTTKNLNAINATLLSMAPSDPIEGMLCSRILVLHNQAMEFMRRISNPEQTTAGVDMNINRANKLFRIHHEAVEALNRHRRKGEQKVTVQHVQVNSGGQAIVNGELNQGGGGNDKN